MLHVRLKEELERLGQKPAAAARAAGEPDSQGLRDVLGGRKRLSADLLAALSATIGVDASYVLTGNREASPLEVLSGDERMLLERYRGSPQPLKDAALRVLLGGESAAPKVVVHGGTGTQIESNNAPINIDMRKKGK